MDTYSAFAMGMANRGKELMVFDWIKAAKLIKESSAKFARAGLCGDWEFTGGDILRDGKPVLKENTYTYLASTWATPQLTVDLELVDCYRMSSEVPEWDADTYWPKEALEILESTEGASHG